MILGVNDLYTLAKAAFSPVTSNNAQTQTSATGATFVALSNTPAKEVEFVNTTGTAISVRYGAGVALSIPDGAAMTFRGLTNANELQIRRTDSSNTQVTIAWNWRK